MLPNFTLAKYVENSYQKFQLGKIEGYFSKGEADTLVQRVSSMKQKRLIECGEVKFISFIG